MVNTSLFKITFATHVLKDIRQFVMKLARNKSFSFKESVGVHNFRFPIKKNPTTQLHYKKVRDLFIFCLLSADGLSYHKWFRLELDLKTVSALRVPGVTRRS